MVHIPKLPTLKEAMIMITHFHVSIIFINFPIDQITLS